MKDWGFGFLQFWSKTAVPVPVLKTVPTLVSKFLLDETVINEYSKIYKSCRYSGQVHDVYVSVLILLYI